MCYGPILLAVLLGQPPATGPRSAPATLSVNVSSQARITFGSTSLVFPDADPDTVPLVQASSGAFTVTAKARTTKDAQVLLTVQASDDLRSGMNTLPASLIAWTGSGDGFQSGVLSRASSQLVAAWTGSGVWTGAQSFAFQNSWKHPPGTYSVTFVYTVSMP
jgi:hypothetical protein